jgi:hypothetical protein
MGQEADEHQRRDHGDPGARACLAHVQGEQAHDDRHDHKSGHPVGRPERRGDEARRRDNHHTASRELERCRRAGFLVNRGTHVASPPAPSQRAGTGWPKAVDDFDTRGGSTFALCSHDRAVTVITGGVKNASRKGRPA